MNEWSRLLFGAVIFFGAGMTVLTGELSEWWTIVSLTIMFVTAGVFLVSSVVEYHRTRDGRVTAKQGLSL